MKVLVIGGRGYIGSALVQHLNNERVQCIAVGSRYNDYNLLTTNFLNSFDRIVLLAGHSSVPQCMGPLKSPWSNNITNFKNLVEKVNSTIPIIYASSSSVYSNSTTACSTEQDLSLECVNHYDLTKTVLDLYANQLIGQGRCLIGLRFGTVNGASPVLRKELMINAMVYSALTTGSISITNRHVNRPILGIKDLTLGIHAILTKSDNDIKNLAGPYNMSSFNTTVLDISNQISQLLKVPVEDLGTTGAVYDFSISNHRFQTTFDFKFQDTIESIVNTLVEGYSDPTIKLVSRSDYFEYPT